MSGLNVYTILGVPTVISFPSPRCLQWSSGGQLLFITKSAVYVLTPDHGINFDNESLIKSPVPKEIQGTQQAISWFRTIVQDDKLMDGTRWPDLCQAWGAVSLGSIDASIMSAECSPSTITKDGRSVIAVMTSNMDISLWKAGKNYLKGEWQRIVDVTPKLLSHFNHSVDRSTEEILQSQSTCMCWTSELDFGLVPHPPVDGSLLIVGSRAGSLAFLRYHSQENGVRILDTLPLAQTWITHIAVSSWVAASAGTCTSYLAFGVADGSVGLLKLQEKLYSPNNPEFSFTPDYQVDLSITNNEEQVQSADKAGLTGLEWISIPSGGSILVFCKPGVLFLWSPPENSGVSWSGLRCLEFERQKVSSAASAFHPASGVSYRAAGDVLTVSLFDGSIHVVGGVTQNPRWNKEVEGSSWTSAQLSQRCRSIFKKVESGPIDDRVMNRMNGLTSYDGGSSFVWAHESSVPSDFSYKHDAKHSSTIVIARLAEATDDGEFLSKLEEARRLDSIHDRLLQILQRSSDDFSAKISLPALGTPLTDDIRCNFRKSLAMHLFGWPEISSLRMRLSLADFVWKFSTTDARRAECGQVAQGILTSISQRTLRTLLRHATAVISGLTSDDIPFIMRLIVQSLLPGSPQDLTEEGRALSVATRDLLPKDPSGASGATEFTEQCPACHVAIPLKDITMAVCANGHHWSRCSITTFILSTPWVRTCVGCSRKAFLPPSVSEATTGVVQLPVLAQGWVVKDLLETVHQCLFCNNSFVSLL
ncbi:hypothetical protein FA13DRAFT_1754967 [Coprinellus micaceus]|uniref:Transcription factor IIIC 90kDa subunit N-terminal domain-containing protein n=1 Tax=Coprinellus micaceus TaxID=71717 RepID=A0A4Y7TAC7_COPMI|nr:hypothetical protein FA13DRAFT_1754967 [Coprinellus micaceus]